MADEIQLTIRMGWDLGSIEGKLPEGFCDALGIDVAGSDMIRHTQILTTAATEEAIIIGDVTVGGIMVVHNPHATAVIKIRGATGETALVDLQPGDHHVFRLSADATAPYAESDTNSTQLQYWLIDP